MVVSLFLIGLLGACGSRNTSDITPVSDVQDKAVSETGQAETGQAETVQVKTVPAAEADKNTGSGTEHPVPQELKTIPEAYFQPADQQGTLVDLYFVI